MIRSVETMLYNINELEAKWKGAVSLVESVKKEKMSAEKRGALLHALENTARRVAYKESTNPGNIGLVQFA